MNKLVLLLFLSFLFGNGYSQDCNSFGNAQIDLNANNIKARLLNSGDLWFDGQHGKYIAPNPGTSGLPEISAIFAGAFWFGAIDPNGALKVAAQQYRFGNNTDFYPGPLELGALGTSPENCENWDRFWTIMKSDVESHIADYNDNNEIDNPSFPIYGWPGRNNPFFASNNGFDLPEDHNLAPFHDQDQDGNYNPDKGDYPLIKGDMSIWWVFNDQAGPHRVTNGTPLSIEVQVMAFAESSENPHIDNATYYDIKVTNQGTDPLLNSFMGLWVDYNLGCPVDDYFGYNEEYQMMYAYNQDDVDGQFGTSCPGGINSYANSIPMIGIKQIGRSDFPVTSFSVFRNQSNILSGPQLDFEYYNMLNGRWKDGTPYTFGGNGFDPTSTDTVSYVFSGEPSDDNAWNMCTADLPIDERQCLMSTGMGTLQSGQSFINSYAVVFVENVDHPCPSLDNLKEAADDVCSNVKTSISTSTSINVQLFPNPAKNVLHIDSEHPIQKIQLLTMGGQMIINRQLEKHQSNYSLDLEKVRNGFYLISIQDNLGRIGTQKVVIQN